MLRFNTPPTPPAGHRDFMSGHARWLLLLSCLGWAASTATAMGQAEQRNVLAPGESSSLFDTGLALTFEAVVEDSRCPAGVSCVWEGDATVRVRIDGAGAKPGIYTLHTNERAAREILHGDVRVRLSSLAPLPTADGPPRAADYRATLIIGREKE